MDPLEDIPVLPDGVEGVLLLRMPAGRADLGPAVCVDCEREVPRGEHMLGDRDGLHCNRCR